MSQLQDNLNEILRQKNAYLLPNNVRQGITVLGVEGNLAPDKPDQTKTVTPTTSEQVITADTGYELGSVTVNAVTSAIDPDIVTNNIKLGVNILGVDGNLNLKFYNSVAAMQSDTTQPNGMYGLVYMSEPQPLQETSIFNKLYFPKTVTSDFLARADIQGYSVSGEGYIQGMVEGDYGFADFDLDKTIEEPTDRAYIIYRRGADNIWTRDDEESGTISYTFNGYVALVNYTRFAREWEDVLGQFMQVEGASLTNLYDYSNRVDFDYVDKITSWSYANSTFTTTNEQTYLPDLRSIAKKLWENNPIDDLEAINIIKKDNNYYAIHHYSGWYIGYAYRTDTSKFIAIAKQANSDTTQTANLYKFNINTGEILETTQINLTYACQVDNVYLHGLDLTGYELIGCFAGDETNRKCRIFSDATTSVETIDLTINYVAFLGWHRSLTQFTATDRSQLLPGVTALGQYGPVTGDGSIYDNIALTDILNNDLTSYTGLIGGNNLNGRHIDNTTSNVSNLLFTADGYNGNIGLRLDSTSNDFGYTSKGLFELIRDDTDVYVKYTAYTGTVLCNTKLTHALQNVESSLHLCLLEKEDKLHFAFVDNYYSSSFSNTVCKGYINLSNNTVVETYYGTLTDFTYVGERGEWGLFDWGSKVVAVYLKPYGLGNPYIISDTGVQTMTITEYVNKSTESVFGGACDGEYLYISIRGGSYGAYTYELLVLRYDGTYTITTYPVSGIIPLLHTDDGEVYMVDDTDLKLYLLEGATRTAVSDTIANLPTSYTYAGDNCRLLKVNNHLLYVKQYSMSLIDFTAGTITSTGYSRMDGRFQGGVFGNTYGPAFATDKVNLVNSYGFDIVVVNQTFGLTTTNDSGLGTLAKASTGTTNVFYILLGDTKYTPPMSQAEVNTAEETTEEILGTDEQE